MASPKDNILLNASETLHQELSAKGYTYAMNNLFPIIYHHNQKNQLISEFKILLNFSIDSLNNIYREFSCQNQIQTNSIDIENIQNKLFLNYANQLICDRIINSYKNALEIQISHFKQIPLLVKPTYIFNQTFRYVIQECIDSQEVKFQFSEQLNRQGVLEMEQMVEDFNAETQSVVTKICIFVQEHFRMKDMEKRTIKKIIFKQIENDVDETHFPKFVRVEDYKKELIHVADIIIDNAVLMIQQIVMEIVNDVEIEIEKFQEFLSDTIEEVVSTVSHELKGFSDLKLYQKMKEFYFTIAQDINNFLLKASRIANAEMESLEKLLTKYHTLANVRTYCVLQMEVSQIIVDEIRRVLLNDFYFLIPELQIFEDQVVLQTIRYFYSYSTLELKEFTIPMQAKNFKESEQLLEESNQIMSKGLQLMEIVNTNSIIFKKFIKTNENYQTLLDFHNLSQILQYNHKIEPYLYSRKNYRVQAIQDIYNSKTGRIAISMMIGSECKILEINQQDLSLVLRDCSILNCHDWDSQAKIEYVDCNLQEIITIKKSQFDYYNSNHNQITLDQSQESSSLPKSRSLTTREDFIKYKDFIQQKKKFQQQKKFKTGNMAGASITSGLGFLIVDSLDSSIPWNQKLKRAGYITVSQGIVLGMTAIPVVGFLIQQALVAFALQRTLGNKVVSKTQKAQNLGHLGVQSSMGIGTAIAGQILIPIPVLGAIIGGTLGGIAIGLYQKFLVSKSKASMVKMLAKLQQRIQEDGLILFENSILKILKINKDFLLKKKPDDLDESQWTTIQLVYLVNEVYFIFNLQYEEEFDKLQKEVQNEKTLKKMHELEIEFENVELMSAKWEMSRNYIYRQQIKTLPLAEQIGQFIQGMIMNFKI